MRVRDIDRINSYPKAGDELELRESLHQRGLHAPGARGDRNLALRGDCREKGGFVGGLKQSADVVAACEFILCWPVQGTDLDDQRLGGHGVGMTGVDERMGEHTGRRASDGAGRLDARLFGPCRERGQDGWVQGHAVLELLALSCKPALAGQPHGRFNVARR